jgi:hypothetical protein
MSADNDFLTPTLGFGKKTPQMMSLERQVRVVAGSWFSPRTTGLLRQSGLDPPIRLLETGLVFAGIADICGMGMLITRMPPE